ncbi:MAG: DUF1573 domain-containing protein [Spirochaetes bacterium]|nr:DUF1573 domain-containing protein [Spirochaetota bacterium]
MLSAKRVPAGGEGHIKISINTEKRKGKLRKGVYVYSNDEENSRLRLSLEANVIPD